MSKEIFKIEKDVPTPVHKSKGWSIYPFKEMEVGDSFSAGKYDKRKANAIRSCMYNFLKSNNLTDRKYTVRERNDELRCWRIK
jgi:hypothetical protein